MVHSSATVVPDVLMIDLLPLMPSQVQTMDVDGKRRMTFPFET